ncbi:MAG: ATP-binding cassette domain-containing protein [Clostridiales bacterium]|nr:ATP-binding cassette domain-containing protein [Clostridiales bacterium]
MICLKNVSFEYKNGNKALKGINLDVNQGEIVVVIGKNGSGKSTLGNVISGIYNYNEGEVKLDDEVIKNKKSKNQLRRKIGIVFQNPDNQIIFNRVYDDMFFMLDNLGQNKEEIPSIIEESLDRVGMRDYINRNPHEMSLGQKQRIAIAEALSINPSYMVFDEATSMLDAKGKKDIHAIIKDLSSRGIGVIFITNIMEEILLADRLVVIDEGKIVKIIKKSDIIDNIEFLREKGFYIPFIINVISMLEKKHITVDSFDEQSILSIIERNVAI